MAKSQNVVPLLIYEDIPAIQRYLVTKFGFEAGVLERDGAGRVVHGEVSLDGTGIWLLRSLREHGVVSPTALEAVNAAVVVLVPDVDAHYEQREYAARDPEGGRWYFATRPGPVVTPAREGREVSRAGG